MPKSLKVKLQELRKMWLQCRTNKDYSMCLVIEKRARALKLSEECKNDPEADRIMEHLR